MASIAELLANGDAFTWVWFVSGAAVFAWATADVIAVIVSR